MTRDELAGHVIARAAGLGLAAHDGGDHRDGFPRIVVLSGRAALYLTLLAPGEGISAAAAGWALALQRAGADHLSLHGTDYEAGGVDRILEAIAGAREAAAEAWLG